MGRQLLITDSWGQHATLDPFLNGLAQAIGPLDVLDPYSGQRFAFDDADHAHDYYLRRCSEATYQQKIQAWVEQSDEPVTLIAFGVGADALWPLLATPLADKIGAAILLDARKLASETKPSCQVRLLLSTQMGNTMALVEHGPVKLMPFAPGFSNPRSPDYEPVAAAEVETWLLEQLSA